MLPEWYHLIKNNGFVLPGKCKERRGEMFEPLRDIRARVICPDGSEEIKKFIPLDELPPVGIKIIGTRYYYGEGKMYELSKIQRTRDDAVHYKYDFYAVQVVDDDGKYVGELYYCVPHQRRCKPNYRMYHEFLAEARNHDTVEDFIEAAFKSESWEKYDVPNEQYRDWLKELYNASNMTIERLVKSQGMTYADFCVRYGIPRRTFDNWIHLRQPPLYMLILFEESLGIISLK